MTEHIVEDLDQLLTLLRQSNIRKFDYKDADTSLALVLRDDENSAETHHGTPTECPTQVEVRSPGIGHVSFMRPGSDEPFCHVGEHVIEYQTLACVTFQSLFLVVKAPAAGTISALRAKEGDRVSFDDPIVTLTP